MVSWLPVNLEYVQHTVSVTITSRRHRRVNSEPHKSVDLLIKHIVSVGTKLPFSTCFKAAPEKRSCLWSKAVKGTWTKTQCASLRGRPRHTSRQNGDMNLRCNSEKKRLEEDNGLISQKLTVRPAWTVNNLIITDLMPLGLTEIEKATLGWGAVNQVCAPRWIISTPAHAKATTDDRYEFKWQLKGTLRRTHIWLTSPTKWFKNVTFF